MLEVRAFSTQGRQVMASVGRPVKVPPGTFLPSPNRPSGGIVRAVHSLDEGWQEPEAMVASRSYLSDGLAAPDALLTPLGWLLDVRA